MFGALNVARAFLPYMREKKTGTVVWIGSVGGWRYALMCSFSLDKDADKTTDIPRTSGSTVRLSGPFEVGLIILI